MAGYSDIILKYGTYGRVYIRHYQNVYNTYEVCLNGFSSTDGWAICRSKGYMYSGYSRYVISLYIYLIFEPDQTLSFIYVLYGNVHFIFSTSPINHHTTVSINCYSYNIYSCDIKTQSYCSQATYLYCHG